MPAGRTSPAIPKFGNWITTTFICVAFIVDKEQYANLNIYSVGHGIPIVALGIAKIFIAFIELA